MNRFQTLCLWMSVETGFCSLCVEQTPLTRGSSPEQHGSNDRNSFNSKRNVFTIIIRVYFYMVLICILFHSHFNYVLFCAFLKPVLRFVKTNPEFFVHFFLFTLQEKKNFILKENVFVWISNIQQLLSFYLDKVKHLFFSFFFFFLVFRKYSILSSGNLKVQFTISISRARRDQRDSLGLTPLTSWMCAVTGSWNLDG